MKAFFQLRVKNFEKFVSALEQITSAHECSNVTVFHDSRDSKGVILLVSDIDPDQLEQFYESPDYTDYAERVGLIGEPEWTLVEEVKTLAPVHH